MIGSIDLITSKVHREKLGIRDGELDSLSVSENDTKRKAFYHGYKLCATRHGCSGATNCNYSVGDYHR